MSISGRHRSLTIILLLLAAVLIGTTDSHAQLSPGPLNRVHSSLEGLENCVQCHAAGQQIDRERCLKCHTVLADRIRSGKGMHDGQAYEDCVTCHVEHQGEDGDLVWWPDGRDKFDHAGAGYILEGKHTEVQCRECHRPDHMRDRAGLVAAKVDVNRTFLGLSPDCVGCHRDEHREQFSRDCQSCHTMEGWKTAARFDHSRTKYPLTGLHEKAACQKCHRTVIDHRFSDDSTFVQFANVRHDLCSDCHEDVHRGRFDKTCDACHTTAGWKLVRADQFDHSKTRFPLLGKHAGLACDKCHRTGQPLTGLAFGRCVDCHQDYHQGQFAGRTPASDCADCHSVAGFKPSQFTVEKHQKSRYRLEGSHLAVPCTACHAGTKINGVETARFTFNTTRCLDCHRDPHRGQLDRFVSSKGCEFCHRVQSWRQVTYDHAATTFSLTGRHLQIECIACHKPPAGSSDRAALQFTALRTDCRNCHNDVHRGQFVTEADGINAGQQGTKCDRCHTTANWRPDLFDHNRNTKFQLVGAHTRVACTGCHKRVTEGDNSFLWFKPVDTSCRHCHSNADTLDLSEQG